MKFKEMPYQGLDVSKIETEFKESVKAITQAADAVEALEQVKKVQEIQRTIQTQNHLASIRGDLHSQDPYYEKEMEFWNQHNPLIMEWYRDYYQAVLQSPYKKELETYLSPMFFQRAQNTVAVFDTELIPLMQEENRYTRQYTKLLASAKFDYQGEERNLSRMTALLESTDREERKQANAKITEFFSKHLEELDALYNQLVHLRDTMAKKLGFANFYTLSYTRMNRIGYGAQEVEGYRARVLKEVVPWVEKVMERQKKRHGLQALKNYDLGLKFPSGNAHPSGDSARIIDNGVKMYHELSKETKSFIDFMVENELLDLQTQPGKTGGAYCEYLPAYQAPFIFANFNGTSGDINILTHEAGHAFQAYQSRSIPTPELIWATSESVEIHSMSMEFFTWPWMELFFGKQTSKYKFGHIVDAAVLLCYASLVDHFQQEVYETPDLTPAQRRLVWRKLEKIYNPWIDYDGNEFYEAGGRWMRQHHIFTLPFYYIEYSLAQVCALQMWERSFQEKDTSAWEDFLKICRVGGTRSFTEIIEMAGIASPFEEDTLSKVISAMERYISSVSEEEFV